MEHESGLDISYDDFLGLVPQDKEKEKEDDRRALSLPRPFLETAGYTIPGDYAGADMMQSVRELKASWQGANRGFIRLYIHPRTNVLTSIHHVLSTGLFLELWATATSAPAERAWQAGHAPARRGESRSDDQPTAAASAPWQSAVPAHERPAAIEHAAGREEAKQAGAAWRRGSPTARPLAGLRSTAHSALRGVRASDGDVRVLSGAIDDVLDVLDRGGAGAPEFPRRCAQELRYLAACVRQLDSPVGHHGGSATAQAGTENTEARRRCVVHTEGLLMDLIAWVEREQAARG